MHKSICYLAVYVEKYLLLPWAANPLVIVCTYWHAEEESRWVINDSEMQSQKEHNKLNCISAELKESAKKATAKQAEQAHHGGCGNSSFVAELYKADTEFAWHVGDYTGSSKAGNSHICTSPSILTAGHVSIQHFFPQKLGFRPEVANAREAISGTCALRFVLLHRGSVTASHLQ